MHSRMSLYVKTLWAWVLIINWGNVNWVSLPIMQTLERLMSLQLNLLANSLSLPKFIFSQPFTLFPPIADCTALQCCAWHYQYDDSERCRVKSALTLLRFGINSVYSLTLIFLPLYFTVFCLPSEVPTVKVRSVCIPGKEPVRGPMVSVPFFSFQERGMRE